MTELTKRHRAFLSSPRKHLLMITNHGVHEWQVIPGLPDTGGQNVFVNQFTGALAQLGFKITVANRGGFAHPITGERQAGLVYKDEAQRILYLEDGRDEFVRKEEMHKQIPALVECLRTFLSREGTGVDLILSHYWDGAEIGVQYRRGLEADIKHVWVPHSLGAIKKRNVRKERWAELRIDERIAVEKELIRELDGVAATSSAVRQVLDEEYDYTSPDLFLPPCVDPGRFHPRRVMEDDAIWTFLSERSGLSPEQVRSRKIVTEISRTDTTKRKDVLIEAFAQAHQRVPDSLLVLSLDEGRGELAGELQRLIQARGIESHTAVVGSVWDWLPTLYAVTDVYCTPSIMEGFGMSAQEAAATAVPVVASHLVPFVVEYLLGPEVKAVRPSEDARSLLRQGSGAVVAQADDIDGFAYALEALLTNDTMRREMGENAYLTTIPYFTWNSRVAAFLDAIGLGGSEKLDGWS